MGDQLVLPDYAGACLSNVVPALLGHLPDRPDWLPAGIEGARRIVLLAIDGLGWEQLETRRAALPTLDAMVGGAITTVAPSTTAAALTSLTTGVPPSDHGIVGYRMHVNGEILNVLRWSTAVGDARQTIPAVKVQRRAPFGGERPPVVTRAEFRDSGFTAAHLDAVRFVPYRALSTLVTEVSRLAAASEPFVYAYYEGLDKVGHEYGLGDHYDAELRTVDRLVADVVAAVPSETAVVLTSDHGQVEVGDNMVEIDGDVLEHVALQSGEGRFRWFHARPGRASALADLLTDRYADRAWIATREQVADERWLGPALSDEVVAHLGDVAVAARADVAFNDPVDTGPYRLVGRHGSLTRAEMLVPLLVAVA